MIHKILRQHPRTRDIPFVIISGFAKNADEWKMDPDVLYITKPFKFATLVSAAERQLFGATMKQQQLGIGAT